MFIVLPIVFFLSSSQDITILFYALICFAMLLSLLFYLGNCFVKYIYSVMVTVIAFLLELPFCKSAYHFGQAVKI